MKTLQYRMLSHDMITSDAIDHNEKCITMYLLFPGNNNWLKIVGSQKEEWILFR